MEKKGEFRDLIMKESDLYKLLKNEYNTIDSRQPDDSLVRFVVEDYGVPRNTFDSEDKNKLYLELDVPIKLLRHGFFMQPHFRITLQG
jgi:hypothetical protein